MSKFCMYCGRELEDDETCNCREKASARSNFSSSSDDIAKEPLNETTSESEPFVAESSKTEEVSSESAPHYEAEQVPISQTPFENSYQKNQGPTYVYHPPIPKDSAVSLWFLRVFDYLKHFFAHPADTISKAANEKDYPVAIFFFIIRALITSTFLLTILRGIVSTLNHNSIFGTRYYTLGSFLQAFGLSTVGFFFMVALAVLVGNIIFCIVSYAVAKLFKSKTSFAAVIGAIGVSNIGIAAAFCVSVILMVLIPSLITPILLGYMVLNFTFTYIALIKSFKLSGNKMTYLFALIAVICSILMMIFYKFTPLSSDTSNLTTILSNLSSGNLNNSLF